MCLILCGVLIILIEDCNIALLDVILYQLLVLYEVLKLLCRELVLLNIFNYLIFLNYLNLELSMIDLLSNVETCRELILVNQDFIVIHTLLVLSNLSIILFSHLLFKIRCPILLG